MIMEHYGSRVDLHLGRRGAWLFAIYSVLLLVLLAATSWAGQTTAMIHGQVKDSQAWPSLMRRLVFRPAKRRASRQLKSDNAGEFIVVGLPAGRMNRILQGRLSNQADPRRGTHGQPGDNDFNRAFTGYSGIRGIGHGRASAIGDNHILKRFDHNAHTSLGHAPERAQLSGLDAVGSRHHRQSSG